MTRSAYPSYVRENHRARRRKASRPRLEQLEDRSVPTGVFQLSAATYSVAENAGVATITVNRTGDTSGAAVVPYNLTDGTATIGRDFAFIFINPMPAAYTVSFNAGETSKTFPVDILNDSLIEPSETVNVALMTPTTGGGTLGAQSTAVLTITDHEPGVVRFQSGSYFASEETGTATITLERINGSDGPLTVAYSTSDGTATAGSNYLTSVGSVTFLHGEIVKTFTIVLRDDGTPEPDETVRLTLGTPYIPGPAAWWSFDDTALNDGIIFDESGNGVDLRVNQFNGITSFNPSAEHYVPGRLGTAYHLEGGIGYTYVPTTDPFMGIPTRRTPDNFFWWRDRIDVALNQTAGHPRLNTNDGAIAYSFWLQLPEAIGADFNPARYNPNFANRHMLIGRRSDPALDGGEFGGQVTVRTVLGFNPSDPGQLANPMYTFELRTDTPACGAPACRVPANTRFPVGQWNHFVVSYQPHQALVYMNGVLTDTMTTGTYDSARRAIEEIRGRFSLNQVGFNGASLRESGNFWLDDLGVWTQALTDADVQRIYQLGVGGALSNTATLTIQDNDALQTLRVTSLTWNDSGFTAVFNRPFSSSRISQYDGFGAGFGPADVILEGTLGVVAGSIQVRPDNRAITFVRTGGALEADTYTATLRSAGNAFTTVLGVLLDGNADGTVGDNYVSPSQVVTGSGVAISVGDFTRGPGQAVNLPASTANQLAIRLSEGDGVTRVVLSLNYDPRLLTIHSAALAPGLPGLPTLTVNIATLGRITLTYNNTTPLGAGPAELIRLNASVPNNGAAYGASQLLTLTSLSINNGAITARADDAVHVAAYVGDASANGQYTPLDSQRIARVAATLDSGFGAYPRIDPRVVADVDGNSAVDDTDATLLALEMVFLDQALIPALPSPLLFTPTTPVAGQTLALTVPTNLSGLPGAMVMAPHNISAGETAVAFSYIYLFDATRVTLTSGVISPDVLPGTLTGGFTFVNFALGFPVLANLGVVVGVAWSTTPVSSTGAGSLLSTRFTIDSGASAGATSPVDNFSFSIENQAGQRYNLTNTPAFFADPTDGLITVSARGVAPLPATGGGWSGTRDPLLPVRDDSGLVVAALGRPDNAAGAGSLAGDSPTYPPGVGLIDVDAGQPDPRIAEDLLTDDLPEDLQGLLPVLASPAALGDQGWAAAFTVEEDV